MRFLIITPSYRQLQWLRLSVASVKDQINGESDFSIEHIIQDGGSEGIEEFAREVGADFYQDGVHVFQGAREAKYHIRVYSERDEGMYDALNRGFARERDGICAWLNSDEQYLPGTLAYVASVFFHELSLQVLLGDAVVLDRELCPVCYRRIMVPNRWHTLLAYLHSLSCAMFFRREVVDGLLFEGQWRVIGDAVLMNRWQSQGVKIWACKKLLSTYAFTGENLSADTDSTERDRWWNEIKIPPKIFRKAVVLQNRIRRFLNGAYGYFFVELRIFTFESPNKRVFMRQSVGGVWPKIAKNS